MLKSSNRGHSCFVPDLNRKVSNFSPLRMMIAVGFCRCSLSKFRNSLLIVCWEFFHWMEVGFCQVLFLHLLVWSCDFSSLECCYNRLTDFQMFNQLCIPGINLTCPGYIILLHIVGLDLLILLQIFLATPTVCGSSWSPVKSAAWGYMGRTICEQDQSLFQDDALSLREWINLLYIPKNMIQTWLGSSRQPKAAVFFRNGPLKNHTNKSYVTQDVSFKGNPLWPKAAPRRECSCLDSLLVSIPNTTSVQTGPETTAIFPECSCSTSQLGWSPNRWLAHRSKSLVCVDKKGEK